MSGDTINLFINSRNTIKTAGQCFINLPNSYIQCKRDEVWTVSVKSFQSVITWYNIQTDYNDNFFISDNANFENATSIILDQGNPNIYEFLDELTLKLADYLNISYNPRTNKFLFSSKDENTYYLKCINCSQFLGFDNGDIIPITPDGVFSDYSINLTSDQLIFVRISGDIGLENSGLANIDTDQFYPNDILFSYVINQVPNSLIDYQTPYENRWKFHISTQSDTIDQFSIRITNEEGRTLERFNDFYMQMQFEKVKTDSNINDVKMIKLLTRITNYLQELYLIITQYLKM